MLLKDRVSAYDFAMKLLEYRNGFDTVAWGKVFLVFPRIQLFPYATNW